LALVIHRRQSCRQREDDGDQIYTQAKKGRSPAPLKKWIAGTSPDAFESQDEVRKYFSIKAATNLASPGRPSRVRN
jgi:hypothetical protein